LLEGSNILAALEKNLVLRREKTMTGLAYFTLTLSAITAVLIDYVRR
jgi:hypothetical protein